jgi:hypothetical protein
MFATWMPPKYKTLPTVICILHICHFFGSSAILGSIINQLVTQNLKGLQGTLWPICYKLYEEKLLVTLSYIQLTPFSHVIIYVLLRRQINKFSHCSWRRFGKMWFFWFIYVWRWGWSVEPTNIHNNLFSWGITLHLSKTFYKTMIFRLILLKLG